MGGAPWGRANNILGGERGCHPRRSNVFRTQPCQRIRRSDHLEKSVPKEPGRNLDARQEWNPLPGDL